MHLEQKKKKKNEQSKNTDFFLSCGLAFLANLRSVFYHSIAQNRAIKPWSHSISRYGYYPPKIALSDNCRSIQFEPLITSKALLNHTIKTLSVKGQGGCEARCYQDDNCVSYNFGPVGGTLPNCELNKVTHQQALEEEFVSREGYIYRHILVGIAKPDNKNLLIITF